MNMSFNIIRKLNEMSESKNEIIKYLKSIRYSLRFHLACCYIDPKNENYNHWKKEIFSMLHEIPKLSINKKYPTYNQLIKWDLNHWVDSLEDYLIGTLSDIHDKENLDISNIDKIRLSNFILDYYKWIYHEFEIKGFVSNSEVFNEINYLIKSYNQ